MALLHPNFAARRPLPGLLRHSQNHREATARAWRLYEQRMQVHWERESRRMLEIQRFGQPISPARPQPSMPGPWICLVCTSPFRHQHWKLADGSTCPNEGRR